MTAAGRGLAGLGALFAAAGALLAYREFLLLGGCLLAVAALCAAVTWAPVSVSVRTDATLVRVARHEPVLLPVTVTRGRDPLGAFRTLAVRVGGVERPIEASAAGSVVELAPDTGRRGVFALVPSVIRRDVLGLAERSLGSLEPVTMIVQPVVTPMPALLDVWASDGPDGLTELDPTSFHTLREYVLGDELRHVHWPTSARLGRPMLRQLTDTTGRSLTVVLDTDARAYSCEADFESAVEIAASLLQALTPLPARATATLRAGREVLVSLRPITDSRPFLDALAAVAPGRTHLDPGRPSPSSLVAVITGGEDRGQRAALRSSPSRTHLFRCTGAEPPSFTRRIRLSTLTAPNALEATRLLKTRR